MSSARAHSGLARAFVALLALGSLAAAPASAINIVLNAGPGISGNAPALAAFDRAAQQWEALFNDPIDVLIDIDMQNLGNPNVLGSTATSLLQNNHNAIVNQLIADASDEVDDGIVLFLPNSSTFTANMPAGYSLTGNVTAASASLKAAGVPSATVDGITGNLDGVITFNSIFNFDFDNSDGFSPGSYDFETIAVHELGHALGFSSVVDDIDFRIGNGDPAIAMNPRTLDLFRFATGPVDSTAFTNDPRELTPGNAAVFGDTALSIAMSTGVSQGDGRQASHWKDDALNGGTLLGVLDPNIGPETIIAISSNDIRALDLIGYEYVPEPGSAALMLVGLIGLSYQGRRRTR